MNKTLNFLVGREREGQVNSNKSCYFKKDGVMVILNCGKGVVDSMRRTHALNGVKEVYQVVTNTDKNHLYDIKKFFTVLGTKNLKPKLLDTISLDKKLIEKMGLKDGIDFEYVEPLKNNFKWINFLATPHKNNQCSCPVELLLDNKKIFYAGDCGKIPFSIGQYDEYYFDFTDLADEYHLDVEEIKKLVKKNKLKKSQVWLVHLTNMHALNIAQKVGMQVAEEEVEKLHKIQAKQEKQEKQAQRIAPTQRPLPPKRKAPTLTK